MTVPALVRRSRARGRASQARRGLSLVELMVGIAVGLFIVAAATVLVSGQLGENRRLMLDTQLQQDLRATADIITRELRRVGAHERPELLISHPTLPATENALAAGLTPSTAGTHTALTFLYAREGLTGTWGFRLDGNAIQTRLGPLTPFAPWQDLTDRNVMQVTAFSIEIQREPAQEMPCAVLCPSGDTSCWPLLQVANFVLDISARSAADATVTRSIRSIARARNDWIQVRTAAGTPRPACPSPP